MGVLFCFGHAHITDAMLREDLSQNVIERLRWEGHRQIKIWAVVCKARVVHFRPLWKRKARKIGFCQSTRQLSYAIGPEVKTDDDITILDGAYRRAIGLTHHDGHDEFVRDIFAV